MRAFLWYSIVDLFATIVLWRVMGEVNAAVVIIASVILILSIAVGLTNRH